MGALSRRIDAASSRITQRTGHEFVCAGLSRHCLHPLVSLRPASRQLVISSSNAPGANDHVRSSPASSSHTSSGCREYAVPGLLRQAWNTLSATALAVCRLLVAALVVFLASLLPRPSPSYAAQTSSAHPTAAVSSTTVTGEENRHIPTWGERSSPQASAAHGTAEGRGETLRDPLRNAADANDAATTSAAAAATRAALAGPSTAPDHSWRQRRTSSLAVSPLADLAAAATTSGAGGSPAAAAGQPAPPRSSNNSARGGNSRSASEALTQQDAVTTSGVSAGLQAHPGGAAASRDAAVGHNGSGMSGAEGSLGAAAGGGGGGGPGGLPGGGGGGGGAGVVALGGLVEAHDPETVALAQQLGLSVAEAGVVRLFERHRASVVNISGMRAMQTFTTLDLAKMPYGQGSGFLWGEKGHVVTCYHLVKGAAEVKVTLSDNSSYTAKVLGYDAAKNLAVLKLSVPKSKLRELQPVTLGSAAGLRVGQTVYGIGNPWGLGHTLSRGLVCGLGQELSAGLFPIKGVILTDTAPDPGSGGGVLLDSKGDLVGMLVTPPASSGGGGGGGGGGRSFAVPIDAVRGLITQILSYGRTVRPALGITMAPAQVLERVGQDGVLVLEVPPGSPAHAAGLRPTHRDIFGDLVLGDIITGLDGKAVRSSSDVYDILDEHRVGDRIKVDVLRDGKQTGLTITLGERLLGAVEE